MLHSYPSVYAIGHKAIEEIFLGPVLIEEKIDGSQFSWGIIDGELQYILEFPFSVVYKKLKQQLPKKRIIGTYKRMASFNFSHYKNYPKIKIVYLNKRTVEKNQKYFNKNLYSFLIERK